MEIIKKLYQSLGFGGLGMCACKDSDIFELLDEQDVWHKDESMEQVYKKQWWGCTACHRILEITLNVTDHKYVNEEDIGK